MNNEPGAFNVKWNEEVKEAERLAEMRRRLDDLMAMKPVALLIFFEVAGDRPGDPMIGVAGLGSALDVFTLYSASPEMMTAYQKHILEGKKLNG